MKMTEKIGTDTQREACIVKGLGMKDIEALVKIMGIIEKGNNAEVRRGKDGITVMEVRKTIVE